MAGQLQSETHNGIQVWWDEFPGTCMGKLTFGVGHAADPVPLLGITHLLEHVLLNLMQPITIPHEGTVDDELMSFTAWGSGDEVADFLNRVAEAIGKIGTASADDLRLEKRAVHAENPRNFEDVRAGLLTIRYGLPGIGNGQGGAPATISFTIEEVSQWCGQWLVQENAALSFTQRPPANLNIVLPHGTVTRRPPDVQRIQTPVLVQSAKSGVALSLLVPTETAEILGYALEFELLEALRYSSGLIYSVMILSTHVSASMTELALVLDPVDARTGKTVRESLTELRRIAEEGFGANALTSARNDVLVGLNGEDGDAHHLDRIPVNSLLGRPTSTPHEQIAVAQQSTSETLRQILAASLGTLLIAYDASAVTRRELPSRSLIARDSFWPWEKLSPAEVVKVSEGGRRWKGRHDKTAIVLTSSHIIEISSRRPIGILFDDIALIGTHGRKRLTIVDRGGRSTELSAADTHHFASLRTAILQRVPTSAVRKFPN